MTIKRFEISSFVVGQYNSDSGRYDWRTRYRLYYRGEPVGWVTSSFHFLRLMARGTWMIPYTSEDEAEFD
jgi:hypothetical protein